MTHNPFDPFDPEAFPFDEDHEREADQAMAEDYELDEQLEIFYDE